MKILAPQGIAMLLPRGSKLPFQKIQVTVIVTLGLGDLSCVINIRASLIGHLYKIYESKLSKQMQGEGAVVEEGQKALFAPSKSGKEPPQEKGVLDGLWGVLKAAKDNIVNKPSVVALTLQSLLAIWQVNVQRHSHATADSEFLDQIFPDRQKISRPRIELGFLDLQSNVLPLNYQEFA